MRLKQNQLIFYSWVSLHYIVCVNQVLFRDIPLCSLAHFGYRGGDTGGVGGALAPPKFLLRELGTPKINAPCVKLNARSGKWVSILLSSLAESHAFSYAAAEACSGLRRRGSAWLGTKGKNVGLSCFFGTPKV